MLRRMNADAAVTIAALTPQRIADYLDFFDHRAFADNPKWSTCYCHFPHADHAAAAWNTRSGAENRAASCRLISAGTMTGWLAYANGAAIGWCNAGARRHIEGLFDEPEPLADRIGAISCFVIAPMFRGQGVARRLLAAACSGLAERGFEWAEAYPRVGTDSVTENHYGPLSMYIAAGFETIAPERDGGVTVRKRLADGSRTV